MDLLNFWRMHATELATLLRQHVVLVAISIAAATAVEMATSTTC